MDTKSMSFFRSRVLYVCALGMIGLMVSVVHADMNEKVAQLDIDTAPLADVLAVFGPPLEYRWGAKVIAAEDVPARNYCLHYDNEFWIWMSRNKVNELRFESAELDYTWNQALRVGMPLEEVLAIAGEPAETVRNGDNAFVDQVLYQDIKGRPGHCYYARSDLDLRLWFVDNRLGAIYVTRSDYGSDDRKATLAEADLPEGSFINEAGRIVDRIDYPFVNDPNALGYWRSVDFVGQIDEFDPKAKPSLDLYLKELYIQPEGKTNWAWRWTKGLLLHSGDKTASPYLIQEMDGQIYMFLTWKSGDYTIRHRRPAYYVLKKGYDRVYVESRVTDRTDYPFIDDPAVIGTWKSIDFVSTPDQFNMNERQWQGSELYLKELKILPHGKTSKSWQTWTRGLIIHKGDQTASRYQIRPFGDQMIMFFEWKSGDYTIRGMKPKYYVLQKQEGSTYASTQPGETSAQPGDMDYLIIPGVQVGEYTFDLTKDDLLERLGSPEAIFYGDQRYTLDNLPEHYYLIFGHMSFRIHNDLVREIGVHHPAYRFANDVGVGDSEQRVKEAFGNDFRLKETQWKDFLDYDALGLQFEIHKTRRTILELGISPRPDR